MRFCAICGNVAEEEQCRICRDPRRDPTVHLRGRGAQGRRRDRADPRVPRPLPRARRRDQPDRGHRPRRPADPRADDPAGRRRGHRGDPRHRPEPRGRGDRDLPRPAAQADGPARHPAGERAAGRRRPGVRRRGHARAGLRREADGSMYDRHRRRRTRRRPEDRAAADDLEDFAPQIADQVESFLLALREIAAAEDPDDAISLLLLEVSQLLLAGGRLGAHRRLRARRAVRARRRARPRPRRAAARAGQRCSEPIDELHRGLRPLRRPAGARHRRGSPTTSPSIAATSLHGLRHYRGRPVGEALWWWQFSYVSTWGNRRQRRAARAAVGGRPRPARRRVRRVERGPGRRRPTRLLEAAESP